MLIKKGKGFRYFSIYGLVFQEIDELLSGGLTDEDEEDIMNELAEMEQLEMPSVPDTQISDGVDDELPDVPTSEPGKSVSSSLFLRVYCLMKLYFSLFVFFTNSSLIKNLFCYCTL